MFHIIFLIPSISCILQSDSWKTNFTILFLLLSKILVFAKYILLTCLMYFKCFIFYHKIYLYIISSTFGGIYIVFFSMVFGEAYKLLQTFLHMLESIKITLVCLILVSSPDAKVVIFISRRNPYF